MENYQQLWDQRGDESSQAYNAFVAYRDLRGGRSIDEACRIVTGQQEGNKRASGRFTEWSQRYQWKERAEGYDAYLERKVRGETEASVVNTHKRDLAAYMDRQRRLSAAATNAAVGLLQKASEGLKVLNPATLKPNELASIFRAASSVAETASNAEAMSLAVEELLKAWEKETV